MRNSLNLDVPESALIERTYLLNMTVVEIEEEAI